MANVLTLLPKTDTISGVDTDALFNRFYQVAAPELGQEFRRGFDLASRELELFESIARDAKIVLPPVTEIDDREVDSISFVNTARSATLALFNVLAASLGEREWSVEDWADCAVEHMDYARFRKTTSWGDKALVTAFVHQTAVLATTWGDFSTSFRYRGKHLTVATTDERISHLTTEGEPAAAVVADNVEFRESAGAIRLEVPVEAMVRVFPVSSRRVELELVAADAGTVTDAEDSDACFNLFSAKPFAMRINPQELLVHPLHGGFLLERNPISQDDLARIGLDEGASVTDPLGIRVTEDRTADGEGLRSLFFGG